MNEFFYNFFVFFGSVLVFLLFTLDLISWATGIILLKSEKCLEILCANQWLLYCGVLSTYLNFFRLFDLVHLYAASSDGNVVGGQGNFIVRFTFEIILILFHATATIIGIILLFQNLSTVELDTKSLVILMVFCHACYTFISIYVSWLKIKYLRK